MLDSCNIIDLVGLQGFRDTYSEDYLLNKIRSFQTEDNLITANLTSQDSHSISYTIMNVFLTASEDHCHLPH